MILTTPLKNWFRSLDGWLECSEYAHADYMISAE